MKVKKTALMLIAAAVWFIAGFNIMRIGFSAYGGNINWVTVALSFGVFVLFHNMVFRKMVKKHVSRITGYKEEKQYFFKFFNIQAYCIMAFMITFGIALRLSNFCPDVFIAVFYTGLGASLLIAGVSFFLHYIRQRLVA